MTPRLLGIATDIDVLPADRVVARRDGYTVVRSPSNPTHYWGNFVVFDEPPRVGDADRWEGVFEREFADEPRVRHRAFTWDREGDPGRAREEFVPRDYELEQSIALVAEPRDLRAHPRANPDVTVRALDPRGDDELWHAAAEVQVAGRGESFEDEEDYRAFIRARQSDRRSLFAAGRGAWYVALDPATGTVAAGCGVVVTNGRGRYQSVDTVEAYRRRGIASRLVVEAGEHAARTYGAERLVIVADADYHALGLYQSLGFRRAERTFGLWRR